MKPERSLTAERPLARHCRELLRACPPGDAGLTRLTLAGERLARAFAAGLGKLAGGNAPFVTIAEPRHATIEEHIASIPALAANSLFGAGLQASPFIVSIEAGVVFKLLDRAFGGRGEPPATLPHAFPLSADLLIRRLEAITGGAIAAAYALVDDIPVRALRRDGSIGQVMALAPGEALTVLELAVTEASGEPWKITLAFPPRTLAELEAPARQSNGRNARTEAVDPLSEPFAAMPLTLRAVLVDMKIPVARLSRLAPGDIIPVAVARSVPLRIADETIAHGTIGAMDDRVAVQITQAFA